MGEAQERDTGDDADTEPDSRTDAAAGHDNDSRPSAIPIVRDSTTRIALALEYRQRVERTQIASGAAGTTPRDDREDRADRTPDEGDQGSGLPPRKDTGVQGDDHLGENAHSRELARRPARGAGLPVSAQELPNARDVLPNLEKAEIDERKFSEYSMNPGHPDNKGKADGWRALGYDVDSPQARREAARELRELTLDESLANGKVAEVRDDSYGAGPGLSAALSGRTARTPRWSPAG